MNRILLILLFSSTAFFLAGQVHYFNNINDNRISKDSVLRIIGDYELKNPGHSLTALIVHSVAVEDSIIHRTIFEKHRLDTSLPKFKSWKYLDLIGERIEFSTVDKLNTDDQLLVNRPTLINFWFTACRPCLDEIPFFNTLHEEFQYELNFVAVSFEPREIVNEFLLSTDFQFSHFVNGLDLVDDLGIEGYPVTFLLDQNSRIIRVFLPFQKKDRAKSPKSWSSKELIEEIKQITVANTK